MVDEARGPFRRGGKPGPLGRQLGAALASADLSSADELLVLMARSAADVADEAKRAQDVKTYTAQVKWLRQLIRDLGLVSPAAAGAEGVTDVDDDDEIARITGEPA